MIQVARAGWQWRIWGPESAPPVLLLHGFTGHGGYWGPIADALGDRYRLIAPDLPGHGESRLPTPTERLAESADDLVEVLTTIVPGPWAIVGYSLGGRLALHLATRHPEQVSRLLLMGAAAGLETERARVERRAEDARRAALLREEGLDAFLAYWEALPLFASQQHASAERRAWLAALRRAQSAEGLAASLECHGLGAQPPLHAELEGLEVPTRWLAGAEDAKFAAIARALAPRMPHADWHLVAGAGHNVPFDQPEKFLDLFRSFIPQPQSQGVTV